MLNEKDRLLLNSYHRQMQQPKRKFIMIKGLIWVSLMVGGMTLMEYFYLKKDLAAQWKDDLPFRIFLMPFAGLLYGWIIRKLMEKKYLQLKKKEHSN